MVLPSSSSSSACPVIILVTTLALVVAAMAGDHYDENVLKAGQRLTSYIGGQELRWDVYAFHLNTDCNFVIWKNLNIISTSWSSNTTKDPKSNSLYCFLQMQMDGNLVLYDVRNKPLWQSNTTGRRGENIGLLRADGNFAIYGLPIWSTRKPYHPAATTPAAAALERAPSTNLQHVAGAAPSGNARYVQNVLYEGESLLAGEELRAKSYRFIMQRDCNLVLYNDNYDTLWASGTSQHGQGCYLELKRNGNLIVYDGVGYPVWHSGTPRGDGDYVLILHDTGVVLLYSKALWSVPNPVSSGLPTTSNSSSLVINQGRKMKIATVAAFNQE